MDKETERVLIIIAELLGVISAICLLIPALREGRLKLLLERLRPSAIDQELEARRARWVAHMRESRWNPLDFRCLVAGVVFAGLCSSIKLVVAFYAN